MFREFCRFDHVADLFDIDELSLLRDRRELSRQNTQRAFIDSLLALMRRSRHRRENCLMATSGLGGINSTSTPASSARTADFATRELLRQALHIHRISDDEAIELQILPKQTG